MAEHALSFYRGVEVLRGVGALIDIQLRHARLRESARTDGAWLAPADIAGEAFRGLAPGSDEWRDHFGVSEGAFDDHDEWARIAAACGLTLDDPPERG